MNALSVLIVDDEQLARRRLQTICRQLPGVNLVGQAEDGDEGLALIRRYEPDVVLLDIKMPGMNGFELLELLTTLGAKAPVVIFVTAFNHYAVRAFEVSAVDYLLKPVAFERLVAALDKARDVLRHRDADERLAEMSQVIAALRNSAVETGAASRYDPEFWVQRRAECVRVPVTRLQWAEAERDYVRLHTETESFLLRESITRLEERLDPAIFIRVHRSVIVRREQISAIRQAGYGAISVQMTNGLEFRVGRTYVQKVRQLLGAHGSAAEAAQAR